jgi:hypothetical protein
MASANDLPTTGYLPTLSPEAGALLVTALTMALAALLGTAVLV